jgi:hypothetical protein
MEGRAAGATASPPHQENLTNFYNVIMIVMYNYAVWK